MAFNLFVLLPRYGFYIYYKASFEAPNSYYQEHQEYCLQAHYNTIFVKYYLWLYLTNYNLKHMYTMLSLWHAYLTLFLIH